MGLPTLAICRGAQTLNVSRNGTLIQHLPDLCLPIQHRQPEPNSQVTHEVEVTGGTLLARTVGTELLEVNSFHHQAIDRLGDDLRISARAPDGVVEAIEAPDRPFVWACSGTPSASHPGRRKRRCSRRWSTRRASRRRPRRRR